MTWTVEAFRHTPDGLVADKRVFTDLGAIESKELHSNLYQETDSKGLFYWHYVRSFAEA